MRAYIEKLQKKTKIKTLPNRKTKTKILAIVLVSWILAILVFYTPLVEIYQYTLGNWAKKITAPSVTIADRTILIENMLSKERLENIYYFSVTTERNFWSERLYVLLNREVLLPFFQMWEFISFGLNLEFDLKFTDSTLQTTYILIILIGLLLLFVSVTRPVLNLFLIWLICILSPTLLYLNREVLEMVINTISLAPGYISWLVEETFVQKNVYIDSNYFLTNDATKGIERFSDLVIPWLVDNGETEQWGPEFGIQNQVDQIRERERHLIMNDFSNDMFPNLYVKHAEDGTLLAAINKPIRRVAFWLDILNRVAFNRELIYDSLGRLEKKNEYFGKIDAGIVRNIYGNFNSGEGKINPGGFSQLVDNTFNLKKPLNQKRVTFSDSNDFLDFILPQKNNIVGDSVAKVGNIQDRKQIIYRGSVNTVSNSVEVGNDLRKPDFNKNTNYIFEKTLQNERSGEYNSKEYLKKYIKGRFNRYWPSKPISSEMILKKKLINSNIRGLNEYVISTIKKYEIPPIGVISNNLENDLYLDNLALSWKNYENTKDFESIRNYSFDFDIWENQEIETFEDDEDFLEELDLELLGENRLGLGNYTYKSDDSTPWVLNSTKNFNRWKNNLKNKNTTHWGEGDFLKLYGILLNLEKNNINLDEKALLEKSINLLEKWENMPELLLGVGNLLNKKLIKNTDFEKNNLNLNIVKLGGYSGDFQDMVEEFGETLEFENMYLIENSEPTDAYVSDSFVDYLEEEYCDIESWNIENPIDELGDLEFTQVGNDLDIREFLQQIYYFFDNLFLKIPTDKVSGVVGGVKKYKIKNIDIPINLTMLDIHGLNLPKFVKISNNPNKEFHEDILNLEAKNSLKKKKDNYYPDELYLIFKLKFETWVVSVKHYLLFILNFLKELVIISPIDYRSILRGLIKANIKYNCIFIEKFIKIYNESVSFLTIKSIWGSDYAYLKKLENLKKIITIDLWLAFRQRILDNLPIIDFPKFTTNVEIDRHDNAVWLDNFKILNSHFINNLIFYDKSYTLNEEILYLDYSNTRFNLNIFKEQSILNRLIGLFDSGTNTFFWVYGNRLYYLLEDHNWAGMESLPINMDLIEKTIKILNPHFIIYDNEFIYFTNFKNLTYWNLVEILEKDNISLNDYEIFSEYYSYYFNQIFLVNLTGTILEAVFRIVSLAASQWVFSGLNSLSCFEEKLYSYSYNLGLADNGLNTYSSGIRRRSIRKINPIKDVIGINQGILNNPEIKSLVTFLGISIVDSFVYSRADYVRFWGLQNIIRSYENSESIGVSPIGEIVNTILEIFGYNLKYYRLSAQIGDWEGVTKHYTLFFSAIDGLGFWVGLNKISTYTFLKNFEKEVFFNKIFTSNKFNNNFIPKIGTFFDTNRDSYEFYGEIRKEKNHTVDFSEFSDIYRYKHIFNPSILDRPKVDYNKLDLDIPIGFILNRENAYLKKKDFKYQALYVAEIYLNRIENGVNNLKNVVQRSEGFHFENKSEDYVFLELKKHVEKNIKKLETAISLLFDKYNIKKEKFKEKNYYQNWYSNMSNSIIGKNMKIYEKNRNILWNTADRQEIQFIDTLSTNQPYIERDVSSLKEKVEFSFEWDTQNRNITDTDKNLNLLDYFLSKNGEKYKYRQNYGAFLEVTQHKGVLSELPIGNAQNLTTLQTSDCGYIDQSTVVYDPKLENLKHLDTSILANNLELAGGDKIVGNLGVGGNSLKKLIILDFDWGGLFRWFYFEFGNLSWNIDILQKKTIWKPNLNWLFRELESLEIVNPLKGIVEETPENFPTNADFSLDSIKFINNCAPNMLQGTSGNVVLEKGGLSELKKKELFLAVSKQISQNIPETYSETKSLKKFDEIYYNLKIGLLRILEIIKRNILLFLFFDKKWLPISLFETNFEINYEKQLVNWLVLAIKWFYFRYHDIIMEEVLANIVALSQTKMYSKFWKKLFSGIIRRLDFTKLHRIVEGEILSNAGIKLLLGVDFFIQNLIKLTLNKQLNLVSGSKISNFMPIFFINTRLAISELEKILELKILWNDIVPCVSQVKLFFSSLYRLTNIGGNFINYDRNEKSIFIFFGIKKLEFFLYKLLEFILEKIKLLEVWFIHLENLGLIDFSVRVFVGELEKITPIGELAFMDSMFSGLYGVLLVKKMNTIPNYDKNVEPPIVFTRLNRALIILGDIGDMEISWFENINNYFKYKRYYNQVQVLLQFYNSRLDEIKREISILTFLKIKFIENFGIYYKFFWQVFSPKLLNVFFLLEVLGLNLFNGLTVRYELENLKFELNADYEVLKYYFNRDLFIINKIINGTYSVFFIIFAHTHIVLKTIIEMTKYNYQNQFGDLWASDYLVVMFHLYFYWRVFIEGIKDWGLATIHWLELYLYVELYVTIFLFFFGKNSEIGEAKYIEPVGVITLVEKIVSDIFWIFRENTYSVSKISKWLLDFFMGFSWIGTLSLNPENFIIKQTSFEKKLATPTFWENKVLEVINYSVLEVDEKTDWSFWEVKIEEIFANNYLLNNKLDINGTNNLDYLVRTLYEFGYSYLDSDLKYLIIYEGSIELFQDHLWSGLESFIENRLQLIWLDICLIFDFIHEFATEGDYEPIKNPLADFYDEGMEYLDEFFWGEEGVSDDLGLRGLMGRIEVGEDPGNEFTTINSLLELPEEFEKWLYFDSGNLLHDLSGLDSPALGELSPSFDISIPIKSLWLVGVFYYNPATGGTIFLDSEGLFAFLKVLYLDRRLTSFSHIYEIIDFKLENNFTDKFVFFRLRLHYFFEDILQALDIFYFNPKDFWNMIAYYLVFLTTYFGVITPLFLFLFLVYFSKISVAFERNFRKFGHNDLLLVKLVGMVYNYTIYRFIYLWASNAFLFIRMSFAIILILSGLLILTEGLHFFSVLRIIDNDQENTKYLGGLFFLLERDPFVEKHTPSDEVWDEFKYDSKIDDDWSRTHYDRETTEILGGNLRERGTLTDVVGFAKKFDYPDNFELDEEDESTAQNLSRTLDQTHNRIVDESSFSLKFIEDSELEREFFREFEMVGTDVEGGVNWLNRSRSQVKNINQSHFADSYYEKMLNIRDRNDETSELLDGRRYDILLYNALDPKWVYDESLILSQREIKPEVFNHSLKQLYNSSEINSIGLDNFRAEVASTNRLKNIISRNKGNINYNPILDIWDEDPLTDMGSEVSKQMFTSYGSLANMIDTWADAYGEPLTQKIRYSDNPAIVDTIAFSFAVNDDLGTLDFYKNEKLLLENSFDAIKRVRFPGFGNKPIHTLTGKDKEYWMSLEDSENYLEEEGQTLLEKLDKNDLAARFLPDNDFDDDNGVEYYFDWLFWDLNNRGGFRELIKNKFFNKNEISLGDTRRRDLKYIKFDGIDRLGLFKDNIWKENKHIDLEYKILNTLNKYRSMNANAFYSNNEFETKAFTFSQLMDIGQLQEFEDDDLELELDFEYQYMKPSSGEESNFELNPTSEVEEEQEELWGAFENYYDSGLRTKLNQEKIKFKDYKIHSKRKNYGLLYKVLEFGAVEDEMSRLKEKKKENMKKHEVWVSAIPGGKSFWENKTSLVISDFMAKNTEIIEKFREDPIIFARSLDNNNIRAEDNKNMLNFLKDMQNLCEIEHKIQNGAIFIGEAEKIRRENLREAILSKKKDKINFDFKEFSDIWNGDGEESWRRSLKRSIKLLEDQDTFIKNIYNIVPNKKEDLPEIAEINKKFEDKKVAIEDQREKELFEGYFFGTPTNVYLAYKELRHAEKEAKKERAAIFSKINKFGLDRLLVKKSGPKEDYSDDMGIPEVAYGKRKEIRILLKKSGFKELIIKGIVNKYRNAKSYGIGKLETEYGILKKKQKKYHILDDVLKKHKSNSEINLKNILEIKNPNRVDRKLKKKIKKNYPINNEIKKIIKNNIKKKVLDAIRLFPIETRKEIRTYIKDLNNRSLDFLWKRENTIKKLPNSELNLFFRPENLKTKVIAYGSNVEERVTSPDPLSKKITEYIQRYNQDSSSGGELEFEGDSDALSETIYNTVLEDNWRFNNKLMLNFNSIVDQEYEHRIPRVLATLQDAQDSGEGKKLIKKLKKEKLREFKHNFSWEELDPDEEEEDVEEGDLESSVFDPGTNLSTTDTGVNPLIGSPDQTNMGYIIKNNMIFASNIENSLDYQAKEIFHTIKNMETESVDALAESWRWVENVRTRWDNLTYSNTPTPRNVDGGKWKHDVDGSALATSDQLSQELLDDNIVSNVGGFDLNSDYLTLGPVAGTKVYTELTKKFNNMGKLKNFSMRVPWGLDIKPEYEWGSTQAWDLDDRMQSFGNLFGERRYELFGSKKKILLEKVASENLDFSKNSPLGHKHDKFKGKKSIDVLEFNPRSFGEKFGGLEIPTPNLLELNREKIRDISFMGKSVDKKSLLGFLKKDRIFKESELGQIRYTVGKKFKNITEFGEYERPDLAEGDIFRVLDPYVLTDWGSDVKFDSGTRRFNFLQRSVKQKTVEREYFLKNRALNTHAVNNKDALDFLWALKKKRKRLRLGKILGNIKGYNLDSVDNAKLINTGWDSKIESPTTNYGISFENYGNFGFDKDDEAFSSSEFDDVWVSNRLNELLGRVVEEDSFYDMYDTILDSDKKDYNEYRRFVSKRHSKGKKKTKTKMNNGVGVLELVGGVSDIDSGKLGDSMSLYKRAGYLASNLKMKIGHDKNRAAGDLSNFLENNILETDKALYYRLRKGKELAVLQRGLSFDKYTDANIADSLVRGKEKININLATERLSSVLKEIYLLNQGMVDEEKEDDYLVEETEDVDDLDDFEDEGEELFSQDIKDSEIFLGEFGGSGEYSSKKEIFDNFKKSIDGLEYDSWALDDSDESLEEFESDFDYDDILDFNSGEAEISQFELINNIPKITISGHIGFANQPLTLNLKFPQNNNVGNDPTKQSLYSGYNTEDYLETNTYDAYDMDNSEVVGLRVSAPYSTKFGSFSIQDGSKKEIDQINYFESNSEDLRFESFNDNDFGLEDTHKVDEESEDDQSVDFGVISGDMEVDDDDEDEDDDDDGDEDDELGFNEILPEDYAETLRDNAELGITSLFQNYGEIGIDDPDIKQIHTITEDNTSISDTGESITDYATDFEFRDFFSTYTNNDWFFGAKSQQKQLIKKNLSIPKSEKNIKQIYLKNQLSSKLNSIESEKYNLQKTESLGLEHFTLWGDLKLQKSELEDYFDAGSTLLSEIEMGVEFNMNKNKPVELIQPDNTEFNFGNILENPDNWYRDVQNNHQINKAADEFTFTETGELSTDLDMMNVQAGILEISQKKPGFFGLYNFNNLNILPDPTEKVDSRFGNSRFKFYPEEIKTNLLDESGGEDPSPSKYELTFERKYGLVREFAENIIIDNVEGGEDGFELKKIDGFFADSEDDDFSEYDTNYLERIAIPVAKGFIRKSTKISEKNSDYILDADLGERLEIFGDADYNFTGKRSRRRKFKRLRKKLNRLLTNSGIRVRAKHKRGARDGIKNFNYYDSLIPSPFIRSLSVDSNLFSKINSLRVFGAGRLDDYIYRPKLENLLKNNDYDDTDAEDLEEFDEFIEEIEEDDIYEDDDSLWDLIDDDELDIDDEDDEEEEFAGEDDGGVLRVDKNSGKYLIDNLKKSEVTDFSILGGDLDEDDDEYDYGVFGVEDIDSNSGLLEDREHDSVKLDQNKSAKYLLLWEDDEPREFGITLPPEKTKTARNAEIRGILNGELDLDFNIFGIRGQTVLDAFEDFTEDDDEIGGQGEFDDEFEDEDDDDEDDLEDTDDDGEDDDEAYDPNSEDPDDSEELEEDSVSRDEWLLELYEDLIENKKRSQKRAIRLTNDQISKLDDQLTNSYFSDLRERHRFSEISENMNLALESALASGNIYENFGNVGTVFDMKNQIYDYGDTDSVVDDSEDLEDEYFSSTYSGDDYDEFEGEDEFENDDEEDEFDDDEEDSISAEALEDLDDILINTFGIISPIENLIEKTSTDFERKFGETHLSLDALDDRIGMLGLFESRKQNKNKKNIKFIGGNFSGIANKDLKISGTLDKTKKLDLGQMRSRFLDLKLQEWGLESNIHEDELEDFENYDSENFIDGFYLEDSYTDDDLVDPLLLKKLQNSDRIDRRGLLREFSDYFLNQIDEEVLLDNITQSNFGTNLMHLRSKNLNLSNGHKFSGIPESKLILNIKNRTKKLNNVGGSTLQILQKSPIELNSVQTFKQPLKHIVSDFILPKSVMGLDNSLGDFNNKVLYRKGNSRDGAIKPRIRWKKLKKKYLKRLDALENYTSKIKNTVLGDSTLVLSKPKLGGLKKKPLHGEYFLDSILNNDSKNSTNVELFSTGVSNKKLPFFLENLNLKKKKIKNKKWKGLEKTWNLGRIDTNLNNSLSLLKLNRVLDVDFLDTTQNLNNIPNLGEIDEPVLNISNPNNYLPVNAYLAGKHNFKSDDISTGGRDVEIDDLFSDIEEFVDEEDGLDFEEGDEDLLDDLEDIDEVVEEEEFGYSRLRNNIVKLMNSRKSETIIPTEILSSFISRLTDIDITSKLAEEYKRPLKYPLEKKKILSGYESPTDIAPFLDKNRLKKINYSFKKLNAPNMHRRSHIVDQFSIYHKNLIRPGIELKNKWSRLNIEPFNGFGTKKILLDRGIEYGLGSNVYRNNSVGRRLDELQIRTFGPEIRLDSTVFGYGRLDKAMNQNLNSEEDYGLFNSLGFPELVEQHIYDETDWAEMAYGGSIFSSKFTDFIWTVDKLVGEDIEDRESEENQRMDRLLFNPIDDEEGSYGLNSLYKTVHILGQIFNLNDYKSMYSIPAGYNRFFSTHNQNLTDLVKGGLKLATEEAWTDILDREENPDLKKLISEKLYRDSSGTDVGPLGFEEGESLYDNRLLNRGWFPEKIIWDFGLRTTTKVGSDPATLELLADYRRSFSHEFENFGINPERQAFRSLSWADNGLFNAIDDVIEGIGIEEDIPYSPAHSEKMWHYFEYESRPNSDKLQEKATDDLTMKEKYEFEEEDHNHFGPDSDPTEITGTDLGNFNLLGLNDLIVGNRTWGNLKYLGGLEHAEIGGTSLGIADNELYDGLKTDFHNFMLEKLPVDPMQGLKQTILPPTVEGLFGTIDTYDSKIPGFSENITIYENRKYREEEYIPTVETRRMDKKFQMIERFRPKDEFSLAPTSGAQQNFETEWVVDGEGWIGNTGSNKPILSFENLPISYIDPISQLFSQPRGVHTIKVADDLDVFGGVDSPYYSLGDFTGNRIIRGRDNDVSGFPIVSSWSMPAVSELDTFLYRDDWYYDDKSMTESPTNSGDFIVFPETATTQRDLWWRAVEGGGLSNSAKKELGSGLVLDSSEKYRDFLLSYDYKIFGKSWLNPQNNNVPLKSYSFYNDSEINSWFALRDDLGGSSTGFSSNYENQLYGDYTYGLFLSSNANFEDSLEFYSVRIRDYIYYILNIGTYLLSVTYTPIYDTVLTVFESAISFLFFKFEIILFFMKYYAISNTNLVLNIYVLYPILSIILAIYNTLLLFYLNLQIFQNFTVSLNDNSTLDNNIIIEFFSLLFINWNSVFEFSIFEYLLEILIKKYLIAFLSIVWVYILLFLAILLV